MPIASLPINTNGKYTASGKNQILSLCQFHFYFSLFLFLLLYFYFYFSISISASDFPSIEYFESRYKTAGGVNLPKIIDCLGSDGKKYKMLVKGNDDLRQDALMQQIFSLMNQLLRKLSLCEKMP